MLRSIARSSSLSSASRLARFGRIDRSSRGVTSRFDAIMDACHHRSASSYRSNLLRCRLAIRCVFWTCNALGAGGLLTLPDVPPSVYYPSGRRWQQRRPKPGGQRSLDPRIGREGASSPGDCQHHGGRELVVRDRVNPGEVLIKVVRSDKPKMLTGLDQNGTWSGTGG